MTSLQELMRAYEEAEKDKLWDEIDDIAMEIRLLDKTEKEMQEIWEWRGKAIVGDSLFFFADYHDGHPKYSTGEHYHIGRFLGRYFFSDHDLEALIKEYFPDTNMGTSKEGRLHICANNIDDIIDKLHEIVRG